jgi:hypothetical protein
VLKFRGYSIFFGGGGRFWMFANLKQYVIHWLVNRVANFSFDPTRRYWIYRGGEYFLKKFFYKNIYWKITYIINKITYIETIFIYTNTFCSSKHFSAVRSTLIYLENQENPHSHVKIKLCAQFWFDKFHSYAVRSGFCQGSKKSSRHMRYWWGLREFLLNTELYCI